MAEVEYRCFVGDLALDTDDRALEQAFSQYGDVVDSKTIIDRMTGKSRGFGFVTFGSEQSMREAIQGMNGKNLDGRNITVNEAQSRGSGGGGYGGGGRREGGRGVDSYGVTRSFDGGEGGGDSYSRGGGGGRSDGGSWRS